MDNGEKIRKLIFVIILIMLVFYVIKGNKEEPGITYNEDGTYVKEEKIELKNILNKDMKIILIYILLIFIFRKNLNVENPNIKSIGRISLMIVSAYLSYLSFKSFKLPDFIAIAGGGGFVIGVVEASTNWKKYRNLQKQGESDRIVWMYFLVTIVAILLDISMSAINFVTIEGKYVITQKMFNEKRQIELARADEKALELLKSLTDSKNFQNARFHAELYFSRKDTTQIKPKENEDQYSGIIMSGFTNLLGSEKWGRIMTNIFIILVSCGITLLMISFEEINYIPSDSAIKAEDFREKSKRMSRKKKTKKSKTASTGASKVQVMEGDVDMKSAIIALLEAQEKVQGKVNKSAIARQVKSMYGSCSRQYVQQIDDQRKQKRIGFGINRDEK